MNKNKTQQLSLILSVLLLSLLTAFLVLAWTDAPETPPGCPSEYPGCDAPINIGPTDQTKSGGLEVKFLSASSADSDKIKFFGTQVSPHTIWLGDSKGIRFWDDVNGELMRITNTGNVGIGTTNPRTDTKLDVAGAIGVSRQGISGNYNSAQVQGIWSTAPNYKISTADNDFGSQYGITYAHTNAGTSGSKKPIVNWGHQILFTSSGTRNASISLTYGHAYFAGNVGIGTTNPEQKLQVAGNIVMQGGGYLDDDTIMGEYNDDWIRLNGYIELHSNTDSYGIVLRDKDTSSYFGITQVGGNSYLTDSSSYSNYFLRGNGPDVHIRDDLTVGDDITVSGNIIATNNIFSNCSWECAGGEYDTGTFTNICNSSKVATGIRTKKAVRDWLGLKSYYVYNVCIYCCEL
ncbi:MAG: hypothetical protein ACKKMP_03055 [Candidatus Nealsonbacteria bacterium]